VGTDTPGNSGGNLPVDLLLLPQLLHVVNP
jgi:hypothetical protein